MILAGGVFNSPQLLMLSGIGPEAELRRNGIEPVHVLERVGKNLQDRYEVAVVNRHDAPLGDAARRDVHGRRPAVSGVEVEPARGLYEQWHSDLRSLRGRAACNRHPTCSATRC